MGQKLWGHIDKVLGLAGGEEELFHHSQLTLQLSIHLSNHQPRLGSFIIPPLPPVIQQPLLSEDIWKQTAISHGLNSGGTVSNRQQIQYSLKALEALVSPISKLFNMLWFQHLGKFHFQTMTR